MVNKKVWGLWGGGPDEKITGSSASSEPLVYKH